MDELIFELGATRVTRAAPGAQWLLHAEPDDAAALSAHCGIALPGSMLTARESSGWAALHLSPDDWLLAADDAAADPSTRLANAPVAFSLVNISDRSMAVDVTGPEAVELIGGACPMDLERLPDGGCTHTLFGKVTLMIWRRGERWRLSYARSYEEYVVTMLRAVAFDLSDEAFTV